MSRTFVQKSNEKVQGKSYMRGSRAVVHNYLVSLFSPCVYNWAREKKEKEKGKYNHPLDAVAAC